MGGGSNPVGLGKTTASALLPAPFLGPLHRVLGVLHRVLGVLHRVLGVLHRVLGVPHRVLGVLHRVLGVLRRVLGARGSTSLNPARNQVRAGVGHASSDCTPLANKGARMGERPNCAQIKGGGAFYT